MPIPNDEMALELNIGAAARVARQSHDDIHHAMFTGDLLTWMRAQTPAHAVE